jgi:hypothetical protein
MYTTRQAAKKLGIRAKPPSNYIVAKKVPSPKVIRLGGFVVHSWTEEEIDGQKLLPTIVNGRKTPWQKQKKKAAKTKKKK